MLKKDFCLNITHKGDRFIGTINKAELVLNKISETIMVLQHQNVDDRRKSIAENDRLDRKKRLGVRKLAEKFGVSVGSICRDRKVLSKQKALIPKK